MPEWWEAAPLANEAPMRPMVAHTPHEHGTWWESAPLVEERPAEGPRQMSTFTDPRLDPHGIVSDEEADQAGRAAAIGLAGMGAVAAGPEIAGPVGTVLRFAAHPGVQAALAGGTDLAQGGSLEHAAWEATKGAAYAKGGGMMAGAAAKYLPRGPAKFLFTRIAKIIGSAAPEADAVAEAAPVVAKAAPVVAEAVAPAARAVKPIRDAATAARAAERRARQLAAAKAAGLDLEKVFGSKAAVSAAEEAAKAAPVAEKAAESALETRLRASVLMKENPQALTDEVMDRVVSIKKGIGKGLSAAQVADSIEELYGFKPSVARKMVDMIFQEMGAK